jgi:predicted nucleic acid-binding protein
LSSARFDDIATGCGLQFAVTQVAASEAMFLHDAETGEREKIDLLPYIERGILQTLTAESETEKLRFIELTLTLDDGEAESVAVAEARKYALATDDKKARNLIHRQGLKIELWSTCSVLRHWQAQCSVSEAELSSVVKRIFKRARYRPKPGHSDFIWWTTLYSK